MLLLASLWRIFRETNDRNESLKDLGCRTLFVLVRCLTCRLAPTE